MARLCAAATLGIAAIAGGAAQAHEPALAWSEDTLILSEEFDEGTLDRALWNVEGPALWKNKEVQAYVDSPDTIAFADDPDDMEDGVLVLKPQYRPGFRTPERRKTDYVSGRIDTRGKFEFAYGRAAARIRMPDAPGVWPAFWLLGDGEWPDVGEIDIMEYVGEKDWTGVAVHGPGYAGDAGLDNRFFFEEGEDATSWHVYAVEWTPEVLNFTVDDRLTFRVTRPMADHFGPWRFDEPKYLILNFALGGAYSEKTNGVGKPLVGLPDETAARVRAGELAMEIDWVRVHGIDETVVQAGAGQ